MAEDVLVPLGIFGAIAGIVWIVQAYGSRTRREIQETVRTAIQSGQNLTPETIRALGVKPTSKGWDLRWGVVLLAIAAAMITLAATIPLEHELGGVADGGVIWPLVGSAAFPGFVGVALVLLYYFGPKNPD
ncbi:MAG: DUF6249 domain-containing protein [Maricaulaceae bacterium]|jgi:hypothetical protein